MSRTALSNVDAIRVTLELLETATTPADRWFAARTLGDLGRLNNGSLRRAVIKALHSVADSENAGPELQWVTRRSICEINGEFDGTSEKYNPQEPTGSLSEQYYLKRG